MDQSLCRLNIVCSPSDSDRLIEALLQSEETLPAFTSWSAQGHGHAFETATIAERVRGYVGRTVIAMVIRRADADNLLARIVGRLPSQEMTYWIEPVEIFGQLCHDKIKQRSVEPDANLQTELVREKR